METLSCRVTQKSLVDSSSYAGKKDTEVADILGSSRLDDRSGTYKVWNLANRRLVTKYPVQKRERVECSCNVVGYRGISLTIQNTDWVAMKRRTQRSDTYKTALFRLFLCPSIIHDLISLQTISAYFRKNTVTKTFDVKHKNEMKVKWRNRKWYG